MSDQCKFDVFVTPAAHAINRARLEHLASLGLDLSNKAVLEVGAGIGLHTAFFEERGCTVLSTDGSPDNVAEIARRYPHRRVAVLDLDAPSDIGRLGEFDVVYCYGTLYHLSRPEQALHALASVCRDMILVETCVSSGAYPELHPVRESPAANMAISLIGCRPTRQWVLETLRGCFGYACVTKTQPRYKDFELDWQIPRSQELHRAVFVGSKRPLTNENLLNELPELQVHAEHDTAIAQGP